MKLEIVDYGEISLQAGSDRIAYIFNTPRLGSGYFIYITIFNLEDSNPQMLTTIVVKKSMNGFDVQFSAPTDSANYKLCFVVVERVSSLKVDFTNIKTKPPSCDGYIPPVEVKVTCNHKWKRYTGLMDAFDYCEICDEKKR